MNTLDKLIMSSVTKHGGKNVPYSTICNDFSDYEPKKIRQSIRNYCVGKKPDYPGKQDIYQIDECPENKRYSMVSLKNHDLS